MLNNTKGKNLQTATLVIKKIPEKSVIGNINQN